MPINPELPDEILKRLKDAGYPDTFPKGDLAPQFECSVHI